MRCLRYATRAGTDRRLGSRAAILAGDVGALLICALPNCDATDPVSCLPQPSPFWREHAGPFCDMRPPLTCVRAGFKGRRCTRRSRPSTAYVRAWIVVHPALTLGNLVALVCDVQRESRSRRRHSYVYLFHDAQVSWGIPEVRRISCHKRELL